MQDMLSTDLSNASKMFFNNTATSATQLDAHLFGEDFPAVDSSMLTNSALDVVSIVLMKLTALWCQRTPSLKRLSCLEKLPEKSLQTAQLKLSLSTVTRTSWAPNGTSIFVYDRERSTESILC